MSHIEIVYFSVTLLLSLVLLSQWKRRHDKVAVRINRGLHSYVSSKQDVRTANVIVGAARIPVKTC